MAHQAEDGTFAGWKSAISPRTPAVMVNAMPAVSICQAVLTRLLRFSPGFGLPTYLEYSDPMVHAKAPISSKVIPMRLACRSEASNACAMRSPNNITTPKKPMKRPATIGRLRKLAFQLGLSNKMNQIAAEADMMATSPLGMNCSTHIMMPLSTKSNSNPINPACKMVDLSNIRYPLKAHHPNRSSPAVLNRTAPKRNGSKPANALWMKKNVDPHTM